MFKRFKRDEKVEPKLRFNFRGSINNQLTEAEMEDLPKEYEGFSVPKGDILKDMYSHHNKEGACMSKCGVGSCKKCLLKFGGEVLISKFIATHLTPITELYVPYGMLSEAKKKELHEAQVTEDGWSNIQIMNLSHFHRQRGSADFVNDSFVYRLDPEWVPKKVTITINVYKNGAIDDTFSLKGEKAQDLLKQIEAVSE